MTDQKITKHDQVLAGLVFSLQAAAMQQLGKVTSPLTGQLERDLDQAQHTIDILDMLKTKCREGTHAEVIRMLDGAVMDLQMNYLDEVKKEREAAASGSEEATPEGGDDPAASEAVDETAVEETPPPAEAEE
ncbi:MAG: DUF1844 domain-containing protein [bacterium]